MENLVIKLCLYGGKLYTLMGHKEKADSLLQAALKTSDLNIKVNIYSSLQKRAEEEGQYEKAMEYLKKHVEAVDTIRKRAEHTKLRELQMKYDKSVALQQNAEIRLKWYLTITIGALILIALVIAYFYSLKLYRKWKEKELFQQKQAAFKLQERIDALQVMVEEKESSHQQEREDVLHEMGILQKEREDALHEITALQNEKEEKEVRVKQLEAMFCAKGIAVAVADAEALQAFLKITEHGEYVPAESRGSLRHWLDITHRQFATRLHEEYPSLTGRETDICYLAALGFSLDAVADLLGVQPRSIERYISRTCEKVGFDKGGKEVFSDFVMGYAHKKGK